MTNLFAWAVTKDGAVQEIYRSKIGAQRGHTRFTSDLGPKEKNRWAVMRLKCLFDELEAVDGK